MNIGVFTAIVQDHFSTSINFENHLAQAGFGRPLTGRSYKEVLDEIVKDFDISQRLYTELIENNSLVVEGRLRDRKLKMYTLMMEDEHLYISCVMNGQIKLKDTKGLIGDDAAFLAKLAGFDEDYLEKIKYASMWHDLGKISIPAYILFKKGRLNGNEYNIIKTHTVNGSNGMKKINRLGSKINKMAQEIALLHHEKYDGKGYPYGLKGEDIPVSARITAIIDVNSALRSKRCYKPGWSAARRYDYFSRSEGEFDPYLKRLFLENFDAIEAKQAKSESPYLVSFVVFD